MWRSWCWWRRWNTAWRTSRRGCPCFRRTSGTSARYCTRRKSCRSSGPLQGRKKKEKKTRETQEQGNTTASTGKEKKEKGKKKRKKASPAPATIPHNPPPPRGRTLAVGWLRGVLAA